MTYGFSRDDIGKFLPEYLTQRILPFDPFQSIDQDGVGKLVTLSVDGREEGTAGSQGRHLRRARRRSGVGRVLPPRRARLRVVFPYRVPVARLAAAHAVLDEEGARGRERGSDA